MMAAVARSLLLFVGIGIASGLAVGVYMAEIRDSSIGIAGRTDGPSVSIIPAKPAFGAGEDVTFRIINTGNVPLYMGDGGVFDATITGLSGIVIYAFGMHDVMQKEEAGRIIQHAGGTGIQSTDQAPLHVYEIQESGAVPDNDADYNASTSADISTGYTARHGYLAPGSEITLSWNQTRHDGESTQSGLYKINIRAGALVYESDQGANSMPDTASAYDNAGAMTDDEAVSITPEQVSISRSATVIIQ